jgi:Lambda phage tail tube protein, TTP
MSDAISAQGSQLKISTGTGGAKTITAISVGNPTILTSTAHGLGAGDVVALAGFTGTNAGELNGFSFVVTNVTANTFAIQKNTVGMTITAGAGTATPASFTTIAEVKTYSGLDGAASEIDVTHLGSLAKEFRLGLVDEGGFTFEMNRVQGDPGQVAVFTSRNAGTIKTYKLQLPNGEVATFDAFAKTFPVAGGVDGVVAHSIALRVSGAVSWA